MKKLVSTAFAALLALSVLARPAPGRGHGPGPFMHAPHHHHYHHRPGPWRPGPPPPRWEPFVAGVIGAALWSPRYVWVAGHYETRTTILPDGRTAATTVWVPGGYVPVR